MKNTSITCMACSSPTEFPDEKSYHEHLLTVHGATSPDQAMLNEKVKKQNFPKDLPPGIPPEALPTTEFLETVKRIEEKPKTTIGTTPSPNPPTIESKPIVLEYRFDGSCPKCKFPVKTIMLKVAKRLFAVCWCPNCNEEIKQVEVKPIKEVS